MVFDPQNALFVSTVVSTVHWVIWVLLSKVPLALKACLLRVSCSEVICRVLLALKVLVQFVEPEKEGAAQIGAMEQGVLSMEVRLDGVGVG